MSHPDLPPSASNFFINLAGGVCFLLSLFYFKDMVNGNIPALSILSLLAAFLPIVFAEIVVLKVHKRPSAGLGPVQPWNFRRIAVKLVGFFVALMLFYAAYHFIPEYDKKFYVTFRMLFDMLLPCVAILGIFYIAQVDRRMVDPEDALYRFGQFCLLQGKDEHKFAVKNFGLSLLLRGYFVPIMAVYFFAFLTTLLQGPDVFLASHADMPKDLTGLGILKILLLGYFFFMTLDMVFAMIGYLAMFRPLDSHVRTLDSTLVGWIVCLLCYYPFWDMFILPAMNQGFFNNPQWFVWLADNPAMLTLWGILVVFAMCTESLATLTFGVRFSNLTYRGIMTSGLFRFTKHPQYVSKCFNRFFVFMPFLSVNGAQGVAAGMGLFLIFCVIYYLRARTEENHLVRYPEYVDYALAMNERSIFRPLAHILPFLKFDLAKARLGRLF